MDGSVTLCGPDGQPAGKRQFTAADGLRLTLGVSPGRRLAHARLLLAAADGSVQTIQPMLQSDAGDKTLDGNSAVTLRWATADWGEERAVIGLTAVADNPPPRNGLRARLFKRGNWLPVMPLDTLPTGSRQGFPPQSASRLSLETLIEGKIGDTATGVLIPGALSIKQLSIHLSQQPCGLTVAVGDNAPFFTADGPLPLTPIEVEGLARALNRYRSDHPQAASLPLLIRCAGHQAFIVSAFEAELEALPPPPTPPIPAPGPADTPRPGEQPWLPEGQCSTALARLCDSRHTAAVVLHPINDGVLSSIALHLRPLGQATRGQLSIHRANGTLPQEGPMLTMDFELLADEPSAVASTWLTARLPTPQPLADGTWWLVCRVREGAALWYADADRPPRVTDSRYQTADGPWLPLDGPGEAPWLQLRVGVLDAAPATT
jgi:hypothetical protein